ncbi:S8 family serine peptidase [Amycolatopsis cynarae]|uniref:S8 family serine peptidase n=1 Tax=Amycolatopsis cynarae TaxID=2995223 RepID=A0ABY7BBQ2_9PSEU|nr:S8 family serine peptidase [Amycolatopsis sp. HUAS 11-8]WAL69791.1 S8 family serine peptidase [Amycolatopsis sp. HUAS 11-8]
MLAAAAGGPPASADEAAGCFPAGRSLRYLVLFDPATPPEQADAQVRAACGSSTGYYPQISVGVAVSADPAFPARIGPARAFSAQAYRTAVPSGQAEAAFDQIPRAGEPDRTGEQWDMAVINAPQARSVTPGDPDVVVGVLDSGIDANHPDLAHAVAREESAGCLTGMPDPGEPAWRPTASAHGTHVAGIIAAADDGRGVTGVAPGVRVASVKVIDDRGYVTPEAAVCGLMWAAARHMKVVNSSFSVNPWGLACARREDYAVVHEALARAVEYAALSGTLTVAAATNDAANLTPSPRAGTTPPPATGCEALPAGLRDVVTTSAVGRGEVKAGYSSYGLGVIGLAAPGGDGHDCVLSTVPGGGYAPLCGTSMAAPHVSGVAALLASAHPGYGPRQLREALYRTARPMPCPADYDLTGDGHQDAYCTGYTAYNGFYGHGMVDARAALTAGAGG